MAADKYSEYLLKIIFSEFLSVLSFKMNFKIVYTLFKNEKNI